MSAGRVDEAFRVLADPRWDRVRREETGNSLATADDARIVIDALCARGDVRVAALAIVHSRGMAVAAPRVIAVVARSGQVTRARAMAANLVVVPDRIGAFRALAGILADLGDKSGAHACVDEVERLVAAMPELHLPMAWGWVTTAAFAAGDRARAASAASRALECALAVEAGSWEQANGLFFAAKACRTVGDEEGLGRVRLALPGTGRLVRNQQLQTAAVARAPDLLRDAYALWLEHGGADGIRPGNLALALADAGLADELGALVEAIGTHGWGESDAQKRWAWALALANRVPEALTAISSIEAAVERIKAIERVAGVVVLRADPAAADALVALAYGELPGADERGRARLVHVLWTLERQAEALALAEDEIAGARRVVGPTLDPRDGALARGGAKTSRRELVSSAVPVRDQTLALDCAAAAQRGDHESARRILDQIVVPLFRSEARLAIAVSLPGPAERRMEALSALAEARPAGVGAVRHVLDVVAPFFPRHQVRELTSFVVDVEADWDQESFAEQYEFTRRNRQSGAERTARLDRLMLVPQRLARIRSWTTAEVLQAWDTDEDGKRLFALGLIEGDPDLVVVHVIVASIRSSRSAFEQYHGLRAALTVLEGRRRRPRGFGAVVRAIREEMDEVPRADGTPAQLTSGTDRLFLARRVLEGPRSAVVRPRRAGAG